MNKDGFPYCARFHPINIFSGKGMNRKCYLNNVFYYISEADILSDYKLKFNLLNLAY